VDAKAAGTNPNECYYREVECCGRDPEYPLNDAQTDTIARLIADDSLVTGIPISRASVHLHSDLDSVNRANDPVPAPKASAFVSTVIEKAIAYRNTSELDDAKAVIAAQEKEIAALEDQISMMSAEIDDLTDRLETTEAKIASASLILEQGAEMRAHTALKGQPA
jgi:SMC interacting uncharacterized protein involved in chromosome segregation